MLAFLTLGLIIGKVHAPQSDHLAARKGPVRRQPALPRAAILLDGVRAIWRTL